LQEVAEPVNKLLITRQVVVTSDIKHGMCGLVTPSLLAVRPFDGTQDVDAVLVWEPDANAIFAVLPFSRRHNPNFYGVPRKLKLSRYAV
jgi:hypothetical protein